MQYLKLGELNSGYIPRLGKGRISVPLSYYGQELLLSIIFTNSFIFQKRKTQVEKTWVFLYLSANCTLA